MNISFTRIISILVFSSLLGIIINSLSSRGIPLVYHKTEIKWGSDSLVNAITGKEPVTDTVSQQKETGTPADTVKNHSSGGIAHLGEDKTADKKSKTLDAPVKIQLETALKLYNKNVLFVDARPPEEFTEGHIKGAYSIPFYAENVDELLGRINKDEPVVVYCSGDDCDLSDLLGNKMSAMGFRKVFVFFGGWNDWQQKHYPVETNED